MISEIDDARERKSNVIRIVLERKTDTLTDGDNEKGEELKISPTLLRLSLIIIF